MLVLPTIEDKFDRTTCIWKQFKAYEKKICVNLLSVLFIDCNFTK